MFFFKFPDILKLIKRTALIVFLFGMEVKLQRRMKLILKNRRIKMESITLSSKTVNLHCHKRYLTHFPSSMPK